VRPREATQAERQPPRGIHECPRHRRIGSDGSLSGCASTASGTNLVNGIAVDGNYAYLSALSGSSYVVDIKSVMVSGITCGSRIRQVGEKIMTSKIALVTGAGSGIGEAVALALARAQFTVVLAGRRGALLESVARQGGERCIPMVADVSDPAAVEALFGRIARELGRLDLLFNNAGIAGRASPLEDLAADDWRAVLDTNVTGTFLCTQAAFRLMKAQQPRGGRIINNGSIAASSPRPHWIAYTASKHAVTGLTRATALEGRAHHIACGQIDIGNAGTAIADAFSEGTLQADLSLKPEPVFDERHVGEAVLYMAQLPLEANVLFMTVMATQMPYVGRG